jgi:hypothetical protein
MDQKAMNIFHCKAFQKLPKLGFFGLKMYHLATLERIMSPFSDVSANFRTLFSLFLFLAENRIDNSR